MTGLRPSETANQRLSLPPSLAANPRLTRWLRVDPAGFVELYPGRVEIGQGLSTALAQIAADELGVAVNRIRVCDVSTQYSPDEGWTNGSKSIQLSGGAIRQVCAEVRELYAATARKLLGTPEVHQAGEAFVSADGCTTIWQLAAMVSLDRDATGEATPRRAGSGGASGRSVGRVDLADKVRGRGRYVHNLVLPGMLHARVIRPPSPFGELVSFHPPTVPGVRIVRDGSFLAVLGEDEARVVAAMRPVAAATQWTAEQDLPDQEHLFEHMTTAPAIEEVVLDTSGVARAIGDPPTVRARYSRQFVAHASIGPSCAVARWNGDALAVSCATQGPYVLRRELARAFAIPAERIVVERREGSGCYGHNGADDAAYEAALIARHVPGRPVRLQWTREDELGRAPYGPAALLEIAASVDGEGRIIAWDEQIWTYGARGRPGYTEVGPAFWAAAQLAEPFPRDHAHVGGAVRNADPEYTIPHRRIVNRLMTATAIRTSSLRSLGAHLNVFAIESCMDELAAATGTDPVEFRLSHLADPRAQAVIRAAADAAGWPEGGADVGLGEGRALGIGYARYHGRGYCAVVAEVEAIARLRVVRLVAAVDVGFVVNPDGVANQVAGGAIQATSWTTLEQVRFSGERILSDTWQDYPILRFSEIADITVVTVPRPDEPSEGAGEISLGPTAAAIGNALAAALGVRVRDMPLTQERILAALADA